MSFSSAPLGFAAESQPAPPPGAEALMAYPKEVRQAALEISLHQNLLVEVKSIQIDAIAQLKKLLQGQPESMQKDVYQVIRFPKLVLELTAGGPKTSKQINQLVKGYPKEIRKPASLLARNQYDLLKNIVAISQEANKKFTDLIKSYPEETRKAFNIMLQHPKALDILARNPNYTYSLGKAYAAKEDAAAKRIQAVDPVARKKDVAAGARSQQELNIDPEAEKLDKAANEFVAKANQPLSEVMDPKKAAQMNISYVPYPYPVGDQFPSFGADPYWYGYPDWEPNDWWWY